MVDWDRFLLDYGMTALTVNDKEIDGNDACSTTTEGLSLGDNMLDA